MIDKKIINSPSPVSGKEKNNPNSVKNKFLLKHSITKISKTKFSKNKKYVIIIHLMCKHILSIAEDSIYVRLMPKTMLTQRFMMRFNNFPRLEIK